MGLRARGWETTNFPPSKDKKKAKDLTAQDVLAPVRPGEVFVYQIRDSAGFIEHAISKAGSAECTYLFDQNHGRVPCTRRGLDSCCIGDATFDGVVTAFKLTKRALANLTNSPK